MRRQLVDARRVVARDAKPHEAWLAAVTIGADIEKGRLRRWQRHNQWRKHRRRRRTKMRLKASGVVVEECQISAEPCFNGQHMLFGKIAPESAQPWGINAPGFWQSFVYVFGEWEVVV